MTAIAHAPTHWAYDPETDPRWVEWIDPFDRNRTIPRPDFIEYPAGLVIGYLAPYDDQTADHLNTIGTHLAGHPLYGPVWVVVREVTFPPNLEDRVKMILSACDKGHTATAARQAEALLSDITTTYHPLTAHERIGLYLGEVAR